MSEKFKQVRPFQGYSVGTDLIYGTDITDGLLVQMRPVKIILREDGALNNGPSVALVLSSSKMAVMVIGQISIEMLNAGLADIGYKIEKLP